MPTSPRATGPVRARPAPRASRLPAVVATSGASRRMPSSRPVASAINLAASLSRATSRLLATAAARWYSGLRSSASRNGCSPSFVARSSPSGPRPRPRRDRAGHADQHVRSSVPARRSAAGGGTASRRRPRAAARAGAASRGRWSGWRAGRVALRRAPGSAGRAARRRQRFVVRHGEPPASASWARRPRAGARVRRRIRVPPVRARRRRTTAAGPVEGGDERRAQASRADHAEAVLVDRQALAFLAAVRPEWAVPRRPSACSHRRSLRLLPTGSKRGARRVARPRARVNPTALDGWAARDEASRRRRRG